MSSISARDRGRNGGRSYTQGNRIVVITLTPEPGTREEDRKGRKKERDAVCVRCYSLSLLKQLGGCPFNGPLSGMKYPTRTKSTTLRPLLNITIKSTIVVRSCSRSCSGGDICGTTPAFRSDVNIAIVAIRNSF